MRLWQVVAMVWALALAMVFTAANPDSIGPNHPTIQEP